RLDDAGSALDRAAAVSADRPDPRAPCLGAARAVLAWKRGQPEAARELCQQALAAIDGPRPGASELDRLDLLVLLGHLQAAAGAAAPAAAALASAVARSAAVFGDRHPWTAAAEVEEAVDRFDHGDEAGAFAEALAAEANARDHLLATATALPERRGLDFAG